MAHWLVVGGAGFLGKHLVQRILHKFDSISVVDTAHYPETWHHTQQIDCYRMAGEDITPAMIEGTEFAVYLAGQTDVKMGRESPIYNFNRNVASLFSFLEAARHCAHPPRIIYISSKNVYGSGSRLFTELDPLAPVEPYGMTKAMADIMCQGYKEAYNLPITVLRNTSTYGPHGRPDLVVSLFIKRALASMPITIYGKGDKRYDFNYVDNLIDAIMLAVKKEAGIYNIASGQRKSLNEWAAQIVQMCNSKSEILTDESKGGESVEQLLSIDKARGALGYSPKVLAREGLEKTIQWFRMQEKTS